MKRSNKKFSQGIYLLPNLFTSVNLFLGFYAAIMTVKGYSSGKVHFLTAAAVAIVVATIFDTLDGRIARLTKTTSQFGMEYDSLADLTTFGIAPALLMYSWGLRYFGRAGWLAVFLYFACVALRLARFNVQSKTVEKESFSGMPCPAGAGLVASIVLLKPALAIHNKYEMLYVLIMPYLLALLMVSTVPYRNFKEIDFKKKFSFSVVLSIVAFIIIVAYRPVLTVSAVFIIYSSSGVVETTLRTLFGKKRAVVHEAIVLPDTGGKS